MKKMGKLVISAIAAVIMMCIFFIAHGENTVWDCPECGKIGNIGNYCGKCAHPAPWLETTATKLKKDEKFTYSTSADFPPYVSMDEKGAVVGIEPEILTEICGRLGLSAQPFVTDFDSAFQALNDGKADAMASGITVREERKVIMDFTIPYAIVTQCVIAKAGTDLTPDDLKGKKFGVKISSTGHIYAADNFGDDLVYCDKYSDALNLLQTGRVDCIIVDDIVGKAYMKKIAGLEMIKTNYAPEKYAFGFAKGNSELLKAFNDELQKMIDDRSIEKIILKWNE